MYLSVDLTDFNYTNAIYDTYDCVNKPLIWPPNTNFNGMYFALVMSFMVNGVLFKSAMYTVIVKSGVPLVYNSVIIACILYPPYMSVWESIFRLESSTSTLQLMVAAFIY